MLLTSILNNTVQYFASRWRACCDVPDHRQHRAKHEGLIIILGRAGHHRRKSVRLKYKSTLQGNAVFLVMYADPE